MIPGFLAFIRLFAIAACHMLMLVMFSVFLPAHNLSSSESVTQYVCRYCDNI